MRSVGAFGCVALFCLGRRLTACVAAWPIDGEDRRLPADDLCKAGEFERRQQQVALPRQVAVGQQPLFVPCGLFWFGIFFFEVAVSLRWCRGVDDGDEL